jgi:hypothetical protein
MIQLELVAENGWINICSSNNSEQIMSNACKDWQKITISVSSVCELVAGWLSPSVDKSKFEISEYEFKQIKWKIVHSGHSKDEIDGKPEETSKEEAKEVNRNNIELENDGKASAKADFEMKNAFLSGILTSRAQLFDLIFAFMEDVRIQKIPYTVAKTTKFEQVKQFYLTPEICVVCIVYDGEFANTKQTVEWFILNCEQVVWKSLETESVATLLDLIYQRGNCELIQQQKVYPNILNKFRGEISIVPEILDHFARTGIFDINVRMEVNCKKCNPEQYFSQLQSKTSQPLKNDSWDI